jgi:hypothetical protein
MAPLWEHWVLIGRRKEGVDGEGEGWRREEEGGCRWGGGGRREREEEEEGS